MISKYTYSISFTKYKLLQKFVENIFNLNLKEYKDYYINIIYETDSGYFNIFQKIQNINILKLKYEENLINISVFIFRKFENIKEFIKFNSFKSKCLKFYKNIYC
jgi:hypothetical protein